VSKGRILIAAYAFPPGEGGVSMAAYEMAHSLGSRGWDIHVLTRQQDLPEDPSRTRCCPITALPDSLTDDTNRLKEYLDAFFKRYPAGFYRLPFLVGLVPEGIAGMRTGKAPSLFSAFPRHAHQPPFLFPRGLPSFFRS